MESKIQRKLRQLAFLHVAHVNQTAVIKADSSLMYSQLLKAWQNNQLTEADINQLISEYIQLRQL